MVVVLLSSEARRLAQARAKVREATAALVNVVVYDPCVRSVFYQGGMLTGREMRQQPDDILSDERRLVIRGRALQAL